MSHGKQEIKVADGVQVASQLILLKIRRVSWIIQVDPISPQISLNGEKGGRRVIVRERAEWKAVDLMHPSLKMGDEAVSPGMRAPLDVGEAGRPILTQSLLIGTGLADTWISAQRVCHQTSDLQKGKMIHSCYFKPVSLG